MAIEKLTERFPDSPRVDVLHGMELEASGRQHDAVVVYQNILASDETNIVRLFPLSFRATGSTLTLYSTECCSRPTAACCRCRR